MPSMFGSPALVFSAAVILRVILLFYGLFQDSHSPVKYTDIDYFVFTDAAKFVSQGRSPYERATYRYTPLLAWLLVPTAWGGSLWSAFGKALFAFADIVAGWLIVRVLRQQRHLNMDMPRALKYASIWLLNPMVATISTRGSSEGLLGVMVIALVWAVLEKRIVLAGALLGLGVHFKIYPFIYAPSIIWMLDEGGGHVGAISNLSLSSMINWLRSFFNPSRVLLTFASLCVFSALNLSMYVTYGLPFMQHTYLHHLTRVDHRHNFSPYNMLLYLSSSSTAQGTSLGSNLESLAFIPQLALSAALIPLALAKKDLAGTMLAQTFAFVTFNKVCTSQYFLWYMIFLPLYLPYSLFVKKPLLGISALTLWIGGQALWLYQGFRLEFHGLSTFAPGLFVASLIFFLVNVWILGIIVADVGVQSVSSFAMRASGDPSKATKAARDQK
ncbi:GPI mannosyltransferase [Histoplasma capsulatum G186AR]|uniref:GPI mannosyltransferase 1 n=2 Tax=Ajellomyces capsulatus TaxID=5037 RepID=C0NVZ4_AJECG|nr:GPI mannosyltransferase [Histoplasma capsulatum G186AR]EEH04683.1 GPI mannosyltransferase [Histoplasma capsulatum G186AR]KAG5296520.1 GPI mannosyltransferase [Histoplasma capsulatum]QSS74503.1 GPI mannosyltransferase [Histoplasma capsulatum G186AR]